MEAFKDYFKVKKNLFNLLILGILILSLPLGINLVRTQQIIRSRAVGDPVVFTGANVVTRNGQLVALAPQVSLRLTSRMGPPSPVMLQSGSVDKNTGQGAPMSLLPQGLVETAYAGVGTCRDNPETPPSGKKWKANCGPVCHSNSDCPKNTWDTANINPDASNWCYGFEGPDNSWDDWRCLMLVRIGCESAGAAGCNPPSPTCSVGNMSFSPSNPAANATVQVTVGAGNQNTWNYVAYKVDNGAWSDKGITVNQNGPTFTFNVPAGANGQHSVTFGNDFANGTAKACTGANPGTFTTGTGPSPSPSPSGNPCPSTCHELTKCDPTCDSTKGEYCSADYRKCADGTTPKTFNPCEKATGPKSCATGPKDDSGPGTACNVNVPYNAANKPLYDLWDGKCDSTNVKLQAAGSGIGQLCCEKACGADAACDEQFAGQGNCNANCKTPTTSPSPSIRPTSSPSILPTGSPRPSPSYPPALSVFTTQFRMAESAADLDNAVWQGYFSDGMTVPYTFKDITPGTKTIFVEFKDSNGKTGGCGGLNYSQPCSASIKLVGSSPVISRCSLSFEGSNTVLNLTGVDFGSIRGTVKSDETSLQVRQWKDTSVTAAWQNAPSGQVLPVTLTNSDGQEAEGQCSATSMISFGAKYICRAASSQGIDNVDLTLIGKFEGGKKVKQKVKVDAQGIISGITEKLEDGKQYVLSIKAPRSLKKNSAIFTAGGGVTNIPNFVLPVGDIFPADEADGTINSLDKAELNRQWIIAVVSAGRSGDFNVDGRVNSIDWACMRYGFGRNDDPEEEPGAPPAPVASPNPSVSASPGTSASPSASISLGPEASASPNPSPTQSSVNPSPSASPSENPWPTPSSGGWRPGWW